MNSVCFERHVPMTRFRTMFGDLLKRYLFIFSLNVDENHRASVSLLP